MTKQVYFYCLKEEFKIIFKYLETTFKVKYAKAGLLDEKSYCFTSLSENFDYEVISSDWNSLDKYLILRDEDDLINREVLQRKGGIKFAVDQLENNNSLVLFLGGLYKEEAIIASKIVSISKDLFPKEFMKELSKYLKKEFVNVNGFYVSKSALDFYRKGVRLTTDAKSSNLYDLKIDLNEIV